jgi:hypothetical protein
MNRAATRTSRGKRGDRRGPAGVSELLALGGESVLDIRLLCSRFSLVAGTVEYLAGFEPATFGV